jgi:hypothetical protein
MFLLPLKRILERGPGVWGGINPGKGNMRRVRRIRWKRSEIVSAILFTLAITILCIYLGWWLATHPFD